MNSDPKPPSSMAAAEPEVAANRSPSPPPPSGDRIESSARPHGRSFRYDSLWHQLPHQVNTCQLEYVLYCGELIEAHFRGFLFNLGIFWQCYRCHLHLMHAMYFALFLSFGATQRSTAPQQFWSELGLRVTDNTPLMILFIVAIYCVLSASYPNAALLIIQIMLEKMSKVWWALLYFLSLFLTLFPVFFHAHVLWLLFEGKHAIDLSLVLFSLAIGVCGVGLSVIAVGRCVSDMYLAWLRLATSDLSNVRLFRRNRQRLVMGQTLAERRGDWQLGVQRISPGVCRESLATLMLNRS